MFKELAVSRRVCPSACCSGLKRELSGKDARAKSTGLRMRYLDALLRELPPRSISGLSTAVPATVPPAEFIRIFNGTEGDRSGMMFSGVAHIPYIDELPSAWTLGRRDVNHSSFVMWDKGGSDTLFSLWKDGAPPRPTPPHPLHPSKCIHTGNTLLTRSLAQGCVYTATSLGATLTPPLLLVTRSAREGLSST